MKVFSFCKLHVLISSHDVADRVWQYITIISVTFNSKMFSLISIQGYFNKKQHILARISPIICNMHERREKSKGKVNACENKQAPQPFSTYALS